MIDVDTHAHLAEQLEHEVDSVWLGSNPVGARFACKMQQGGKGRVDVARRHWIARRCK